MTHFLPTMAQPAQAMVSKQPSQVESGADAAAPEPEQLSSVKVVVRVRPPVEQEHDDAFWVQTLGEKEVLLTEDAKEPCKFAFSRVAGPEADQDFMFQVAGTDFVANCLAGYNGCLLAYGQTGSGKSFTMGTSSYAAEGPSRGLTQRIFESLFGGLEELQSAKGMEGGSCGCSLECSFFEIYNEEINDLLDPAKRNLDIRGARPEERYVQDLTKVEVGSVGDVLGLLRKGMAQRAVAETKMNDLSSRSHSVLAGELRIIVTGASGETCSRRSRMYLVDLAGSERQKQTGAVGARLKESCAINSSLLALGDVIKGLADRSSGLDVRHIRFRDSKLTHLLEDSLGGNSKTTLIANISTVLKHSGVTLQTLQFAAKAAGIKKQVVANEDTVGGAAMVAKLQADIQRLQKKLATVQQGNGLTRQNARLERWVEDLESQNQELQSMLESERDALAQAELENASLQEQLQQLAEERSQLLATKGELQSELSQLATAQQRLQDEHFQQQEELGRLRRQAEGLVEALAMAEADSKEAQAGRGAAEEELGRLRGQAEGLAEALAAAEAESKEAQAGQRAWEEKVQHFRSQTEGLAASLAAAQADSNEAQAGRRAQEAELERLRVRAECLASALAAAEAECKEAQAGRRAREEEVERLWGQVASLAEELNAAQAARQQLLQGRAMSQDEREELLAINMELQSEMVRLRDECQREQAAVAQAQEEFARQAADYKAALAAANADRAAAEGEGGRLAAELEAAVATARELQAQLLLQQQAAAGFKDLHRQLRTTQARLGAAAAAAEGLKANEAELQARLKAKGARAEGLRSQLSQLMAAQQEAAAAREQQLRSELSRLHAELAREQQAAAKAQHSGEVALKEALDAAAADRRTVQAAVETDLEAARQEVLALWQQLEASMAALQISEEQQAQQASEAAALRAQMEQMLQEQQRDGVGQQEGSGKPDDGPPSGGEPGAEGEEGKGAAGTGPSVVGALRAQLELGQELAALQRQLRESQRAAAGAAAEATALREELAEAKRELQARLWEAGVQGAGSKGLGCLSRQGEEPAVDLTGNGDGEGQELQPQQPEQQQVGSGGRAQQPARRRRLLPDASWLRDPPSGEGQEEGPAARRDRGQQGKPKAGPGVPMRAKPVLHSTNHYHYNTHPPPK